MKTFRLIGMALITILMCITACSDGKDEPDDPTPQKPDESAITIDTSIIANGVTFTTIGGEKFISFSSNADWTLNIAPTTGGSTWCTVSTTSGSKGEATVKFTATENTEYEDRSVAVTIKAGTASKTFTITQKCKDAMLLTSDKFEVSQKGGSIEVEVKANINYQMEISETAKSWITPANTRALTARKHTFNIAANEEYNKREGEIYFINGEQKEVIKVYQSGSAVIMLTKNDYTVSDKGETVSVEIKSNFEYGVKMPDVDWINDISTRGTSSHTLKYVVSPNETYDSRSAQIIYYDKSNTSVADTLTITQAQKDAIIISKKEITLNNKGETIMVKLSSNVDYEVIMPSGVTWINAINSSTTRSLVDYTLYYKIDANKDYDDRKASIIFRNTKDNLLADTLTITQLQLSNIILSSKKVSLGSTGTTIDVNVTANIDYNVIIPDEIDWIKNCANTRGLVKTQCSFIISPNVTYDNREAKIIFKSKENETVSDTLTITQAQKDAIIISKKEYEASVKGEVIEVELASNIDYNISIAKENEEWISQVESKATRTLTNNKIYFKIAANNSDKERIGKINISDGKGINETITITQEKPLFELTSDKIINVSYKEETIEVKLNTNIDFDIEMPQADWIKRVPDTRGLTEHAVKFTVSENTGNDSRSADIVFTDKNKQIKETVMVTQQAFIKTVTVKIGGTLSKLLGDQYLKVTALKVIGPLNGDDIRIIKAMGGNDYKGNSTSGNLSYLDLSDASIVEGGDYYYYEFNYGGYSYTSNDKIGERMFYNCSQLKTIMLPNSVTTIENQAFSGCTGLTSITIPNNVTTIGYHVFENCTGLTSVTIPNSVTTIEAGAFWDCTGLTNITIPNSVTSIGDDAFERCTGLTSITIGSGVTTIGNRAFYNCTRLTSITIPNSVTSIGYGAFFDCTGLTSVNIGSSVTTIEDNTFSDCKGLTSINIGSGVTTIGFEAFSGCTGLTSITIPNSVTTIEWGAFSGCTRLTSVTIGSSVTTIEDSAFWDCTGLTNITIPNSVTTIGGQTFYNCTRLTSVNIPNSVTTIGCSAFCGCKGLTSITIPNSVTTIEAGAFSHCTGLTSITIPNSVTTIENWAFWDCTGLTNITIPNSVTTIEWGAFSGCTGLTSVTIGSSVTTIEDSAFSDCSIKECHIYATTPPKTGHAAFSNNTVYAESTLYVPKGCVEIYKKAGWESHFYNIVEMD